MSPGASRQFSIALIGICLLGLVLRLWGIGSLGDLDFDEQASSFIGAMDPLAMLRYLVAAPFEHPPLFYLLFHVWLGLVGTGETAMRLFAVIPGTLAIGVTGAAVARSFNGRAGITAALLVAVSPLQVFESRDARMYSLLSLCMAGLLLLVPSVAAAGPRGRPWRGRALGALLVAASALMTHYYAFLGVAGAAIGGAAARAGGNELEGPARGEPSAKGRRAALIIAGGAVLLGIMLAAVWLVASPGLRLSLTAAYPRVVAPSVLFTALLSSFGASMTSPIAPPGAIEIMGLVTLIVTVAIVVLIFVWKPALDGDEQRIAAAVAVGGFVAISVGVPLLLIVGRAYAPRFVALATPFLSAVLGIGATRMHARWSIGGTVVLCTACLVFLAQLYGGYSRSDYGHALAELRSEARADDAIVLNGPWQDLLYQRYGFGLPPRFIIASTVPLNPDEAVGWLQRLISSHPRLWVVDSATDEADPYGVVADWLDRHAYPRPVIPFEKALLRPYLTDFGSGSLTERPLTARALDVQIDSVAMDSWTASPDAASRFLVRAHMDGGGTAVWRMYGQLTGPNGATVWHWDGPLAGTANGLEYRAAVVIPKGVAEGNYALTGVVYEAASAEQHDVLRIADPVALGTVQVR